MRGFGGPAPRTAGTWLHLFTLGHIRGLDKALAAVEGTSYRAAGVDSVTLDFDATYVISVPKRRQGADRTYKRGSALHAML